MPLSSMCVEFKTAHFTNLKHKLVENIEEKVGNSKIKDLDNNEQGRKNNNATSHGGPGFPNWIKLVRVKKIGLF